MSGSRRLARQYAFVVLCSIDLAQVDPSKALSNFWVSSSLDELLDPDQKPLVQRSVKEGEKAFAERLVMGVRNNLTAIDEQIQQTAHNWSLDRMAKADLNLLRIGVFELLFDGGTPKSICINEAVELAKKFGEHTTIKGQRAQSATFINGVLDTIAKKGKSRKKKHKADSAHQNRKSGEGVDFTKRKKGSWAKSGSAEVDAVPSGSETPSEASTSANGPSSEELTSDAGSNPEVPNAATNRPRRKKGANGLSEEQAKASTQVQQTRHRLHTRRRKPRTSNAPLKSTQTSDSIDDKPSVDLTKRKKGAWDSED